MISLVNLKKRLFMQLLPAFRSEPLEPEGCLRSKHYNFFEKLKIIGHPILGLRGVAVEKHWQIVHNRTSNPLSSASPRSEKFRFLRILIPPPLNSQEGGGQETFKISLNFGQITKSKTFLKCTLKRLLKNAQPLFNWPFGCWESRFKKRQQFCWTLSTM